MFLSRALRLCAEFSRNCRYYGLLYASCVFARFLASFFLRHIVRRQPFSKIQAESIPPLPAEWRETVPDTRYVERQAASVPQGRQLVFYIHLIVSLGDIIACEPVVRYLKMRWRYAKVFWIVKENYASVLTYNPFIDKVITVQNLAESSALLASLDVAEGQVGVDLHFNNLRCTDTGFIHHNGINPFITFNTYLYYGNLLESFCLCAGMEKLDLPPAFYLSPLLSFPENLPQNYVVFHCKSNMRIKDWTARKWNALAKKLLRRGCTIVELGSERIIRSKEAHYVDCTSVRDLQLIALIISRAQAFVGIDSGFAHIANCFGIKSVLIFGIYHHYTDYRIYSGNFASCKDCRIVFDHRYGSFHVKVRDVEKAFLSLGV